MFHIDAAAILRGGVILHHSVVVHSGVGGRFVVGGGDAVGGGVALVVHKLNRIGLADVVVVDGFHVEIDARAVDGGVFEEVHGLVGSSFAHVDIHVLRHDVGETPRLAVIQEQGVDEVIRIDLLRQRRQVVPRLLGVLLLRDAEAAAILTSRVALQGTLVEETVDAEAGGVWCAADENAAARLAGRVVLYGGAVLLEGHRVLPDGVAVGVVVVEHVANVKPLRHYRNAAARDAGRVVLHHGGFVQRQHWADRLIDSVTTTTTNSSSPQSKIREEDAAAVSLRPVVANLAGGYLGPRLDGDASSQKRIGVCTFQNIVRLVFLDEAMADLAW